MQRSRILLGLTVLVAPALFGQNARSAVSVAGLDTNPCTVASPCRSFGTALTATAAGGEIVALDSAGYGPFSIGKAVTISGAPGVHAAISVTSGAGITVAANIAADRIILRNLVLIGAGGAIGIDDQSSLSLRVIGCLVRGFTQFGIHADDVGQAVQAPGPDITIDHSAVLDNVGSPAYGVFVDGGISPIRGTLTNSSFEGNSTGIHVDYNANVAISNCTISNSNAGVEVIVTGNGGFWFSYVMIENSTISNNTVGVHATGDSTGPNDFASIAMSQLVLSYNTTATSITNLGTPGFAEIRSFGNNRFVANGSDGSGFLSMSMQ